jgi:hypothetical protein
MTTEQVIPNDVAALFKAANEDYAKATANVGEGLQGEWPPPGTSDHYITDIDVKAGKFRLPRPSAVELPCVEVHFHYREVVDDKSPNYDPQKEPLEWRGARFQILPVSSIPVDSSKTRARIDSDRLKGHCTTILGESSGNLMSDLQQCIQKIRSSSAVAVRVRVDYRDGNQRTNPNATATSTPASTPLYKTEFLTELLSG